MEKEGHRGEGNGTEKKQVQVIKRWETKKVKRGGERRRESKGR